ncbi:preprotein translocase subunit YajC [Sanguibacter massiliensis]|uniref:preprotein translocase subunit YajC n=1 Tax=Sanguibacter massiliensis TaxID=1973217 RepID=UPI000C81A461|nr:preprotein translocase subunit YajC [Sanguibacter massiliensis]
MTDVTNLAAATGTGGSSGIFLYVVLGALVLMMFFGSRRARKQQREASAFRDSLEVGTEVMTGSGFFGTIVAVEGDRITLVADDGGRSTWIRQAIAKVVEPVVEDDGIDVLEEDGTDTPETPQDQRPTND